MRPNRPSVALLALGLLVAVGPAPQALAAKAKPRPKATAKKAPKPKPTPEVPDVDMFDEGPTPPPTPPSPLHGTPHPSPTPAPTPVASNSPSPVLRPSPVPSASPSATPTPATTPAPSPSPSPEASAAPTSQPTPVKILRLHGTIYGGLAINPLTGFSDFFLNRTFLTGTARIVPGVEGNLTFDTNAFAPRPGQLPAAFVKYAYLGLSDPALPFGELRLGLQPTPFDLYEQDQWGDFYAVTLDGLTTFTGYPLNDYGVDYRFGWGPVAVEGMISNGEGGQSFETDGQKTYQGFLTLDVPYVPIQLVALGVHGNPVNPALDPSVTVNPNIAPGYNSRDTLLGGASWRTDFLTAGAYYAQLTSYGTNGSVYPASQLSAYGVFQGGPFWAWAKPWELGARYDRTVNGDTFPATFNAGAGTTMAVNRVVGGLGYRWSPAATMLLTNSLQWSEDAPQSVYTDQTAVTFKLVW